MTKESLPYKMRVDLNVLDHLADGLYSSVAAVLTEAVANAWDADATEVSIDVDITGDTISIVDNGIGMDERAINDQYLLVGYRRREEGEVTGKGRLVMGRKGIGKLSLLSIANVIEVKSKKRDKDSIGLRITVSGLRKAMEERRPEYNPEPIFARNEEFENGHGTKIRLTELKRERLRDIDPGSLRRRLARRFSVIGSEDFRVMVNGKEVTPADREDLKFVEYVWIFGDSPLDTTVSERLKKKKRVDDRLDDWPEDWYVRGWIGTVDKPRRLTTPEGNLNSVVVMARGRLVDEDILPRITGAEVHTKYVTGQIEADFLDESGHPDIVTSPRQKLIEDDERVVCLIDLLKRTMRRIADTWSELRVNDKKRELHDKYPRLQEWLNNLEKGWRSKAESLLEKIATMEIEHENEESENSRKILLRHAVLGFERLRLRGDAEELEQALERGVNALLRLFADRDALEASFYRDIVTNRLEVIKELERLTGEDAKESVLQKYLFSHLWLLDPAWERATGSEEKERRLRLKPPFKDDDETKEKYGRVDIRYRTVAGKHVIVELKRVSRTISLNELTAQGYKYVDAMREILSSDERDRAIIEVIFVVGKEPNEPSWRINDALKSVSPGSRIVTYDLLIERARQAYEEYLRVTKEIDRLERIFD